MRDSQRQRALCAWSASKGRLKESRQGARGSATITPLVCSARVFVSGFRLRVCALRSASHAVLHLIPPRRRRFTLSSISPTSGADESEAAPAEVTACHLRNFAIPTAAGAAWAVRKKRQGRLLDDEVGIYPARCDGRSRSRTRRFALSPPFDPWSLRWLFALRPAEIALRPPSTS